MASERPLVIGTEIPEQRYKVDFEILDRFQSFSKELLRLAFLGMAGCGFLLSRTVYAEKPQSLPVASLLSIALAAAALSATTACAVAHLYFSTDSMVHFVTLLRRPGDRDERRSMICDFKISALLFQAASIFLCMGVMLVGVAFLFASIKRVS